MQSHTVIYDIITVISDIYSVDEYHISNEVNTMLNKI